MVLRLAVAALALGLLPACIHSAPVAHLASPVKVRVAFYADRADQPNGGRTPDELIDGVKKTLIERNLEPELVAEPPQAGVDQPRTTSQRLQLLAQASGEVPLVMLVETKVVYDAQMEGRFKWNVYARISLAKSAAVAEAVSSEFTVPVFLLFAHEREQEALVGAAPTVANRAGRLADQFLGGRTEFPKSAAAAREVPRAHAVYFVLVDRFANGDPRNDGDANLADPAAFHGGDLQGVIDHLDHIQSLGFDTVWLSPVWKMRHEKFFDHGAFHGYWVEDFGEVEPRFGDRRLLRRLSDELHRRGMRLVLDVVLNHVAFDSPLLKEHPDWFHRRGNIQDWNDRTQLETFDVMGLPDLAQEREDVYRYLLDTSLRWNDEVHPDGFRLDAVKHIPRAFWARYNAEIHAHAGKSFWLLGEDFDGDPAHLAETARSGGFDAMFDFPLYFAIRDVFCGGKPVLKLAAVLSLDRTYPSTEGLVTLADNHDLPRLATACHGQIERVKTALRFLFVARGTPSVSYGTEVGLTGEHEPENRGDMSFTASALDDVLRQASSQRGAHEALQHGEGRILEASPARFTYARVSETETALIDVEPESLRVSFVATKREWLRAATRPLEVELHGAPTRAGDRLILVGAGPELGAWNPGNAPRASSAQQFALELPSAAVYEFKFAIQHSDGTAEWETRDDRFLFVPPGTAPLHVEAKWNEG